MPTHVPLFAKDVEEETSRTTNYGLRNLGLRRTEVVNQMARVQRHRISEWQC